MNMDYTADTRQAYRNKNKAQSYKQQFEDKMSWVYFTMRREISFVRECLLSFAFDSSAIMLDFPCGTGMLSKTLNTQKARLVAGDVSCEMMELASGEYDKSKLKGFVQADILKPPFKSNSFDCIITLGLMHRLPDELKEYSLRQLFNVTKRFVIISFSVDNLFQRIKRYMLAKFNKRYVPSPSPQSITKIKEEIIKNDFAIRRQFRTMPFLSSEVIFLLEK